MTRLPRWLFHGANAAVTVTGLVLAWMSYLCRPADAWAVVNHPWQPHLQHLHILAAPLLTGVLGWFVVQHGWVCWKAGTREGRRSGGVLLLLVGPMVLSGYALQVSAEPAWRLAWAWMHGVSAVLWVGMAALHVVTHRDRDLRNRSRAHESRKTGA